jgi:hypothetical protein
MTWVKRIFRAYSLRLQEVSTAMLLAQHCTECHGNLSACAQAGCSSHDMEALCTALQLDVTLLV